MEVKELGHIVLYVRDLEHNEIELYIDVQPETCRDDPAAIVAPTRPLRL